MAELDLEAVAASVNRACEELAALCKGQRWRMSIPAQPDRDSDLIISAGLTSVDDLLAKVAELQARVDVLTDQVNGKDEQIARVRALHPKRGNPRHGCCAWPKICGGHPPECGGDSHGLYRSPWPCAEIRALDGEPAESEAEK